MAIVGHTYDKSLIIDLRTNNPNDSIADLARKYCSEKGIDYQDHRRKSVSRVLGSVFGADEFKSESSTSNYFSDGKFSALGSDGKILNIQDYCINYGLDYSNVRSFKLISHTGVPFYNIVFYEQDESSLIDIEEVKSIIDSSLSSYKYTPKKSSGSRTGVVKIADLHAAAIVKNLIRTKEFSVDILRDQLIRSAVEINRQGYELVHVHILGDLVESFTGLNHMNSFKGLDVNLIGAEGVKLVTRLLHEDFLNLINNLGEVKIVAGNHDRVTSSKSEDYEGGVANLVAWGLELIGYSV